MKPADLVRLVTLAALWGASYLFMRVAVPHTGVAGMVEGRTLAGGLVMAAFVVARGIAPDWRRHGRGYLVVGLVGVAIPFALIGVAVRFIDASTAAILNATSPLFGSLVAAIWIKDRLTAPKIAGIALSIAGIAILVGWTPRPMSAAELGACGLCLAACACYGYVAVFAKARMKDAPATALSAMSCLVASGAALPFAIASPPAAATPATAWLALAALGVACTGIAFILYYRLIADLGPVRATMVTLLIPVFGILWGALFLDEPLTPGRLAGAATVLAGCAFALGLVRWPGHRPEG